MIYITIHLFNQFHNALHVKNKCNKKMPYIIAVGGFICFNYFDIRHTHVKQTADYTLVQLHMLYTFV